MIAYDDEDDKIKHYRVDKMRDIELVEESRNELQICTGIFRTYV